MPLLIGNGKPPLRLPVALSILTQPLDRRILPVHAQQKLNIGARVLVARVDLRVVGQRGEDLVERAVHLGRGALEKFAAAAGEEGVAGEDGAVGGVGVGGHVFQVVADAVLGVAGGVEGGDGDVFAERELGGVWRGAAHEVAVTAADDGGGGEVLEHGFVAAGVVPVVVGVEDGG